MSESDDIHTVASTPTATVPTTPNTNDTTPATSTSNDITLAASTDTENETYGLIPGTEFKGKKDSFTAKIYKISSTLKKHQSVRMTKNTHNKLMLRCMEWKEHNCPFKAGIHFSRRQNCWVILNEPFFCLKHTCPENVEGRQRSIRTDMILNNSNLFPRINAYSPDISRDPISGKKSKKRNDIIADIIELGKEDGLQLKRGQARCIMLHKINMLNGGAGNNNNNGQVVATPFDAPDETDVQALMGLEVCQAEEVLPIAAGTSTEGSATLLTSMLTETEKIKAEAERIAAENAALEERLVAKERLAKVISENRELRRRLERAESMLSGDDVDQS